MSKRRRFRVLSLEGLKAGDVVTLPADELKHLHVLRLDSGAEVELHDENGRHAHAALLEDPYGFAVLQSLPEQAKDAPRRPVTLAVAWPKGKRAALLVEKCTELGVHAIQPVAFARGVVHKDDESEGVQRLRRIAAEAAKQSGRPDLPEILPEVPFDALLTSDARGRLNILLDPRAETYLAELLLEKATVTPPLPVWLVIGPEGGFNEEELERADRRGFLHARLARHVLRVETAALAACAVCSGILDSMDA